MSNYWIIDPNNSALKKICCTSNCNCTLKKKSTYVDDCKTQYSNKKKAGVLLTFENKILIIQSRGRLWGVPKGGIETGETAIECAFRELAEESGIVVDFKTVNYKTLYLKNGVYFRLELDKMKNVQVADTNDSTGVGWITKHCLLDLVNAGRISCTRDLFRLLKDV